MPLNLPVPAWNYVREQLVGCCPHRGSHWGIPAWRPNKRHRSQQRPCCKWQGWFPPEEGRDFCGEGLAAAHWWSGRALRSGKASERPTNTHTHKKKTKMKMRVTLVCVIEFTHVDEGNVCCLSCTVQELWCWDPFTAALITDNQNKYIKLI